MHFPSAVEPFVFRGITYYIKRDDTLHSLYSGNKYRKLNTLINTPKQHYHKLISYGGIQSNAMLSIAALCEEKGWLFEYWCKPIPRWLEEHPTGNFAQALALGMQYREIPTEAYQRVITDLQSRQDSKVLVVRQGGADAQARQGVNVLANELKTWIVQHAQPLSMRVVIPSGTGTTAFYLAQALPEVEVMTTAVVGDREYLIQQMKVLGRLPENLRILAPQKKHHFAKPYPELLALYRELYRAGIEFDLIYGAKMWYDFLQISEGYHDLKTLYVHSGGLSGNATMLERYRHKEMV